MRAIEKRMLQAVSSKRNFRESNTEVTNNGYVTKVYLHGNCIYRCDDAKAEFNLCGWNTSTTRSRLKALGVGVYCKNFTPMVDGKEVSSCGWIKC